MAELELELRRSEEASRAWRKRAGEAEAVARVLSQAMDQTLDGSAGDNSRCGGSRGRCRVCGCEVCKVVFVPCMHLAACSLCADILASCPVCESAKQDTLEVLLPTEQ
ncbi:putative BOI-related E3 ubiquitin-protein ligase 3 [Wolffia australiana]